MSDSVDRVFVHALATVKKIPKTGASRPPPTDRMRLYGLYKQAMEGDVDGVMERPTTTSLPPGTSPEELSREQDKWDAWKSQTGLSRTEAKRRYVEALIETMHRYANTPNALELVSELEFVWNQVRSNEPSSEGGGRSSSSTGQSAEGEGKEQGGVTARGKGGGLAGFTQVIRRFGGGGGGVGGGGRGNREEEQQPMRVLSPMSEPDESEARMAELAGEEEDEGGFRGRNDKRSKRMERAIVRLSAEIAALREQIATGREWRTKKDKGLGAWLSWGFWGVVKHFTVDLLLLVLLLIWMRKRKDRRFEDHIRGLFRLGREYARKVLPSR
ncbi:acyl CoA binding protein-domain-containing protein [Cercophora samala]|uniref:Acyl CoA binding protein-domain-containing protein n=1 Tax=Cercophora samala TaxID=330535 RepID=A0AA40DE01_9PEZI|nr:acyl CoA binding protein-domain-containing protein [Cercophora samala]